MFGQIRAYSQKGVGFLFFAPDALRFTSYDRGKRASHWMEERLQTVASGADSETIKR